MHTSPLLLCAALPAVLCLELSLFVPHPKREGGTTPSCRDEKAERGHISHPRLQGAWVRLLCADYQISQKQQVLERRGGWAAAGGWQPGLVLAILTSLSRAAGWLGMLTRLRGDQFVLSPQARGDKTFPFRREEAQQGHDQDDRTVGWQVPGLENRELKAQLGAATSMVSHI